jgi:hypothetical protein
MAWQAVQSNHIVQKQNYWKMTSLKNRQPVKKRNFVQATNSKQPHRNHSEHGIVVSQSIWRKIDVKFARVKWMAVEWC